MRKAFKNKTKEDFSLETQSWTNGKIFVCNKNEFVQAKIWGVEYLYFLIAQSFWIKENNKKILY